MRRTILALLAAGLLSGGVVAVRAASAAATPTPEAGLGGPFMHMALEHLRELDLSDAQRQQAHEILLAHRQEFEAGLARLKQGHESLREASTAETIDEAALRERAQQMGAAVADLAVLKAHVHHDLRALLTPEQRAKAEAQHDRLKGHFEHLLQFFHGSPPPAGAEQPF